MTKSLTFVTSFTATKVRGRVILWGLCLLWWNWHRGSRFKGERSVPIVEKVVFFKGPLF